MFQVNGRSKLLLGRLTLVFLMTTFVALGFAQFAGGNGTADDPFQVQSVAHLDLIRANYVGAEHTDVHFIQTAHIDIGGIAQWDPIGDNTNRFFGSYDGDGFEIRNMRRSTSMSRFGFFGVTQDAVLDNIHLRGVDIYANSISGTLAAEAHSTAIRYCSIVGRRRYINSGQGGMVAQTSGNTSFFRCWIDMSMTDSGSGGRAGAIVGRHSATGEIAECFAIIDMVTTGANDPCAGGLVADLRSGSLRDSYVIGNIRATQPRGRIGGLVTDKSTRPIDNCYAVVSIDSESAAVIAGLVASGTAASVTESYWNAEVTGLTTSPGGGEPKNTGEMLQQDTYVRWDFVEEPIWNFEDGHYPWLAWFSDEPPAHVIVDVYVPPSNVEAEVGEAEDRVTVTWDAPSVVDPLGYNVYRNGRVINVGLIDDEEFVDMNVDYWEPYTYSVTAVYMIDDRQTESDHSPDIFIIISDYEGLGTAAAPYLVTNANQLSGMRYFLEDHFLQTEDIDLAGIDNWVPVGTDATISFTGSYNGQYHLIENLTINRNASNQGLFGYAEGGRFQNIVLVNLDVRGSSSTGGIFGYVRNARLDNCYADGSVHGSSNLGLLAGYNNGSHTNNSFVSGSVTATSSTSSAGGLYGYMTGTPNVNNCYSFVAVTGHTSRIGGLIGTAWTGTVRNSYAAGPVEATVANPTSIGGIIGHISTGSAVDSYWNTETTGQEQSTGGGEGMTTNQMLRQGTFEDWDFEDIWGMDEGNTYPYLQWQVDVVGYGITIPGPHSLSAEVGDDGASIDLTWGMPGNPDFFRIYRDNQRYDTSDETAYNDDDVEEGVWYEYRVTAIFVEDGEEMETTATNTVRFRVEPQFAGGDGTADNPWQVHTAAVFDMVRNNLNAHYIQIRDIDLSMFENWVPIGATAAANFSGSYDGNGHLLSNMRMRRSGTMRAGLFGYANGTIKNLGVINVDMEVSCCSGVIVGELNGTVENCFTTGLLVTQSHRISGLVGRCGAAGVIRNSYSLTETHGGCCHGGVVGVIGAAVQNSFAAGPQFATGTWDPRGLAGSGTAGNVTNSYWDRDATGVPASGYGGTGRTTAQMTQQAMFVNWDFGDDDDPGVWSIMEGMTYPSLTSHLESWGYNFPGPSGLEWQPLSRAVDLSWNAHPADPDGYNLYLDGELVNEDELIGETEYRITGLTNWQEYTVQLTAVLTIDGEEFETLPTSVTVLPFGVDGDGTADDPFIISTAQELDVIVRMFVGDPDVHFEQGADIDLRNVAWELIGTSNADANAFRGTYDGAGFEISNLAINVSYAGMFGYTRGAVLKNMHLVDVNIDSSNRAGGLVAYAWNTRFENCSVVGGRVNGRINQRYGGLVAETAGNTSIHQCWTDVRVQTTGTGGHQMGGLVGYYGSSGDISESFALGDVSSDRGTTANINLGGLVGQMASGRVINSYAMGDVTSTADCNHVGGLIGGNNRPVINSYSTGLVTSGGNNVGGLLGQNTGQITNSYWNVESSGQAESQGGTGLDTLEMLDIDSYVEWDFGDDDERGVWSKDQNSFPYLSYEGEEAPAHVIPTPTLPPSDFSAEIVQDGAAIHLTWEEPSMLEPIGYHVYRDNNRINPELIEDEEEFTDTNVQAWTWYSYHVTAVYMVDGQQVESGPSGAVRIMIMAFAGGDGESPETAFLIETVQQLNGMQYDLTAHYRQIDDIDLAGINWRPVGHSTSDQFTGYFDGGGFEIRNMRAEGNDSGTFYRGFFGYTGNGAVLKNINIVNMGYSCGHQGGGLVGRVNGSTTIENCSATGTMNVTTNFIFGGLVGYATGATNITRSWTDVNFTGNGYRTGGLVGEYLGSGTISECYTLGNISTTSTTTNVQLGGLVGRMAGGQIRNSYARGNVTSTQNRARVGGLIGENTRPVENSYSTGRVSSTGNEVGGLIGSNTGGITESYWDMDTSGIEGEGHGQGRRTADMTFPFDPNTYVRWDFEDVWARDAEDINNGYPVLAFQVEITDLDTPEVSIEIIDIEGTEYARLNWDAITNARSYIIYASSDPGADFEDWEQIDHINETRYDDEVDLEESSTMFYRVIAVTREVPDGRRGREGRRAVR